LILQSIDEPKIDILPTKPPVRHLAYLDGVRAFAALYVMVSHIMGEIWAHPHRYHGFAFVMGLTFHFAHIAVGLFIVLSGFCLMLPVIRANGILRGGALDFFKRRALRILPTYYLSLAFSLILIFTILGQKTGTLWDCAIPVTKMGLLVHLLMLQDIWFREQINYTHWSVAVEWLIYFCMPALVMSYGKIGALKTTLLVAIVSTISYFLLANSVFAGVYPQYYLLFTLGLLGATIAYSKNESWEKWRSFPYLPCSALFIIPALVLNLDQKEPKIFVYLGEVIVGILSLCLLVGLSLSPSGKARRFFETRFLVWVGTFSYSLYLVHAPLVKAVLQYIIAPMHQMAIVNFLLLATGGSAIIVVTSYGFARIAEFPFVKKPAKSPDLVEVTVTRGRYAEAIIDKDTTFI
jgi:peptidoglycan/LPS O-acetylase OafA/YrhL